MNSPELVLSRRAGLAKASLYAVIGADLVATAGDYELLQALAPSAGQATALASEALELAEAGAYLGDLLQLAALVACAVLFLRWFHRGYASLVQLGETGLEFSPRWAVGGFFVPILNFIRPYQVMQELWQRGSRRWKTSAGLVAGYPSPRNVVGAWWIGFVATSLVGNAVARASLRAEAPLERIGSARLEITANLLDAAAAVVAIALVANVTRLLAPLLRGTTIHASPRAS